jgi:hypothetical protein
MLIYNELKFLTYWNNIMSAKKLFKQFNEFLIANSGVTGSTLEDWFGDEEDIFRANFFRPYQSKSVPFFKAASIVTAPIAFTAVALECLVATICLGLKALVDLVTLHPSKAFEDLVVAGVCVLGVIRSVALAITSPIINAVDLVGSGVATLGQNNEDLENDEQDAPRHSCCH